MDRDPVYRDWTIRQKLTAQTFRILDCATAELASFCFSGCQADLIVADAAQQGAGLDLVRRAAQLTDLYPRKSAAVQGAAE